MEQQEKILEVKNLRVNFNTYAGKIQAVRGVSFSLYKGETLAIVGESGCGKTVTSKALLRLYQPPLVSVAEGSEILYDGQDVLKMNKKQLQAYRGREVGMIFQDPMTSLNPTMKVGDQIAEALRIHNKISKKEAAALAVEKLRLVDIPNPEKGGMLSSPAFRRDAAAGGDCHRAFLQPENHHCRRTNDRAGRHHPGPNPGPIDGNPGKNPYRYHPGHP